MAIAFVQYDDFLGSGDTIANDNALNTTTGNILIAVISNWDPIEGFGVVTGVADTAGNTYTKAFGVYRDGGTSGERLEIWYAKNITGNANNITTATMTDMCQVAYISVSEFSGVDTTSPLDDFSTNSETNQTSHSSGNATSSAVGALIVGGYQGVDSENMTVGVGFTTLSSDLTSVYFLAQYEILGGAGDYDSDCTSGTTTSSINGCAIFKEGVPGWSGKISGVTNPAKVAGVDKANIAKVKGIA